MARHFETDEAIRAVVEGFENCTTGKEGFTHLSHLTVAAYYLCHSTPDEAFEKMRLGLLRFLDHHGVGRAKYDDGLTRAWIVQVQNVIEQSAPDSSLVVITNRVLERLVDTRIAREAHPEAGAVKT